MKKLLYTIFILCAAGLTVILCLRIGNEMNNKLEDYSSLKEKEEMETNVVISSWKPFSMLAIFSLTLAA